MYVKLNKLLSEMLDKLALVENTMSELMEKCDIAKVSMGDLEIISQSKEEVDTVFRAACDAGGTINALLKEASKK